MNDIVPFKFEDHDLRVIAGEDGEAWFNANDVCEVLDLGNPRQALTTHVDEDDVQKLDTIDSLGRKQPSNHVNIYGIYALVLGSSKPEAKKFKRWVTHDVLPAIHKTGAYIAPQRKAISVRDLMFIGREIAKLPGVSPTTAMAHTLATIQKEHGSSMVDMMRGLPAVSTERMQDMNATEIGKHFDMSPQAANKLLAAMGLQRPGLTGEARWWLTPEGEKYAECRQYARNGHEGNEIRWFPAVIQAIRDFKADV